MFSRKPDNSCYEDLCKCNYFGNFIKRHVTLTPDQKKIYEQMKKAAMAVLNGKVTTTMTVLTQLMRLQQITCGHFKSDDGTIQHIKSNRMDELLDVLAEVEGKAVIWAHWQQDVEQIMKTIRKVYSHGAVVDYYGLTPNNERQDNICFSHNKSISLREIKFTC